MTNRLPLAGANSNGSRGMPPGNGISHAGVAEMLEMFPRSGHEIVAPKQAWDDGDITAAWMD